MVMVVHTPAWSRRYFSPNALAGWPDGIRYEARIFERKKRRLRVREQKQEPMKPATALEFVNVLGNIDLS